ncbi:hypothetical protein L226DRAFT_570702 [Lentinus tigrinus ALCF2SS1-7]|uniref:F-box domain-containing protein n=1 Tax=Lentinus tigrinus ALCF2SS1-6 TaxID=1328759 RepID=A0A5C2SHU8_9APHY|nr:hypothetical protein L227DRAFT_610547 [Lentinus tigrinus ALCF2SS1-6]RPD75030.1 hypothetical protein L226DRAFT_570702 [Lentinus tigrinus ALCF2SS1-7]
MHSLPQELVCHVLQYLATDLEALLAASLTCHHLLPAAREHLFAVVSGEMLLQDYMKPYLEYVTEVRFRPVNRRTSSPVPIHEILWHLRPDVLPRLTALSFLGLQFWNLIGMLPGSFKGLSKLTSVTELTLSGMSFLNLRHIQTFVCSLPNLSALNLHRITYADPSMARRFSVPLVEKLDIKTRPRIRRLAFSPDGTTTATSQIAEWLARSPSADSLVSLLVPYSARSPQYVLSRFGPSVEHLSLPIRDVDKYAYDGHLERYTSLHTLTIFMDSYNMSQGSWYILIPFLEHGIGTQHLQKLTIDVRVEFVTALNAVIDWAALDRLKDVLECTHFDALREVEVIVQHKEELPWNPAEEMQQLLKRVEERLYGLSDGGVRVVTRYWRVKEFYDTIISLQRGVL